MKKKHFLFLILIVNTSLLCSQNVIGYLPYYRENTEDFDYSKYTHLHYFTIWPGANGEFIYPGNMDSLSMATQFHTIANKAKTDNTKIVMTFGGPSEHGSLHFVSMASNDSIRAIFVNNVLKLCLDWNIDGIDIDWEWAQHTDIETSNYAFTKLMEDLRKMTDDNDLSLSVDVSASSWNGKYYNPEALKLADYINVMTYTYNGAWSGTAGHHSSMHDIINTGLPYWTNKGIPSSKLNIGTAFFGHVYEGTFEHGGTFSSVSSVLYSDIQQLIENGYSVIENNTYGTYCFSETNNKIIYYDSPLNVAYKMEYAKNNNYGGLIIWEIGQDDSNQTLSTAIDNARKGITSSQTIKKNKFPFELKQNNNILKIENAREISSVAIYSINGERLIHNNYSGRAHSIFLKTISPGIYILNITQNNTSFNKKIIIH